MADTINVQFTWEEAEALNTFLNIRGGFLSLVNGQKGPESGRGRKRLYQIAYGSLGTGDALGANSLRPGRANERGNHSGRRTRRTGRLGGEAPRRVSFRYESGRTVLRFPSRPPFATSTHGGPITRLRLGSPTGARAGDTARPGPRETPPRRGLYRMGWGCRNRRGRGFPSPR